MGIALMKDGRELVSLVGEYYVLYKLATLGIRAYKLFDRYDYDLMSVNNVRIEVKTARPMKRKQQFKRMDGTHKETKGWIFANFETKATTKQGFTSRKFVERKRTCDFYCFVCTDEEFNILHTYIIPNEEMTISKTLWFPESNVTSWSGYKENWSLLLNAETENNEQSRAETQIEKNKLHDYPIGTYSTIEVAEKVGYFSNQITTWCKEGKVETILYNARKGKPLYRITEKGLQDVIKLVPDNGSK